MNKIFRRYNNINLNKITKDLLKSIDLPPVKKYSYVENKKIKPYINYLCKLNGETIDKDTYNIFIINIFCAWYEYANKEENRYITQNEINTVRNKKDICIYETSPHVSETTGKDTEPELYCYAYPQKRDSRNDYFVIKLPLLEETYNGKQYFNKIYKFCGYTIIKGLTVDRIKEVKKGEKIKYFEKIPDKIIKVIEHHIDITLNELITLYQEKEKEEINYF
jgi:hypothetical protein